MQTLEHSLKTINPHPPNIREIYLSSHNRTGDYGETYVTNLLRNSGYIAQKQAMKRFCGDIRCTDRKTGEIIKVEVKTSFASSRGTYNFCLRKPGKTDCTYSDYVFLLCIDPDCNHYLYVAHCNVFNGASHFTITSHPTKYSGKLSPFRVGSLISFDDIRITERLYFS